MVEWVHNKLIYANPQSSVENKPNLMMTYDDFYVSERGYSVISQNTHWGIWTLKHLLASFLSNQNFFFFLFGFIIADSNGNVNNF